MMPSASIKQTRPESEPGAAEQDAPSSPRAARAKRAAPKTEGAAGAAEKKRRAGAGRAAAGAEAAVEAAAAGSAKKRARAAGGPKTSSGGAGEAGGAAGEEAAPKKRPRAARAAKNSGRTEEPEAIRVALEIARLADDKKAERIEILDIRGLSGFADALVICSANSEPHLKAVASGIREGMREGHGRRPLSEAGSPVSNWVVIDYIDVVAHIFGGDRREFYGLEQLWGDAPRVPYPPPVAAAKAARRARRSASRES